ncbi:MAG TPA: lactonase family protein [Acetobacteraceae bacterium]|nr:lactonase family protein [Acetobacteraceae bacterium]
MSNETLVYVGTYTEPIHFGTGKVLQGKAEGIYRFLLDPASGALQPLGKTTGVANPSYLAFDHTRRFLYAVNELKSFEDGATGTVSAFAVEPATGELTYLNRQPTHGTDPCHVVVDRERRHVFVANFSSGSVCVLPVRDDGSLDAACDFVQHLGAGIDPVRQNGPHAHSVTLDRANRFAFVPDLGLDKLLIYKFDAQRGMLEPNGVPWIKLKPGAGPRHLALHPGGRFGYLVNELNRTVAVLGCDRKTGAMQELQVITTLPEGFGGANTCADIHVAPSGRFVYASNRGHDSIAIFRVDQRTGRLTCIDHAATQGRTPRNFCLDPTGSFLLVANQDSDTIVTFRIDARSGMLETTGHVAPVPTPVCVKVRAPAMAAAEGGHSWRR